MAGSPPPPTRIISWMQQVIESDPLWNKSYQRPWCYEFSNGRRFLWDQSVYQNYDTLPLLLTEDGFTIMTEDGRPIEIENKNITPPPFLLAEDGSIITTEDNIPIILE